MLGLFGTLNLGSQSLQTQRQGVEVAGHNLANVNNPGYSRQRLSIQTAPGYNSKIGPVGTGAEGVAVVQIRSQVLDAQLQTEFSVRGSLQAQHDNLDYAQSGLGQFIDQQAAGAEGSAAAQGVGGQNGIAEGLTSLFNAFQSLSTNPTSTAERQVLVMKASELTTRFNQVDLGLSKLQSSINDSIKTDVAKANDLLSQISALNEQISTVETQTRATANDLRDLRQQRIEDLSTILQVQVSNQDDGSVSISTGSTTLVDHNDVKDTLETYTNADGNLLLRTASDKVSLDVTGGSIHGDIQVRDGELKTLRKDINLVASTLINEVNSIHSHGYSLNGTTGESFFSGTDASNISVNSRLLDDASMVQASADPGAKGDNQVILQIAKLGTQSIVSLGNQTLGQKYSQTVSALGQALSSATQKLSDQQVVEKMLTRQRDSVSGVSLDEEMTDLTRYQKAFTASAKLITTIDEMIDTVVNLKR